MRKLKIFHFILIGFLLTSCNTEKKHKLITDSDFNKIIKLEDLYSKEQIDENFKKSNNDLKKFIENNGVITYDFKQEFLSETNKSRGGLYTKTYLYPYQLEKEDYFTFIAGQMVELLDSKELDFRKTNKLIINSKDYETYEIYLNENKFGYFIILHIGQKIISINLLVNPFVEPDFQLLNQKLEVL